MEQLFKYFFAREKENFRIAASREALKKYGIFQNWRGFKFYFSKLKKFNFSNITRIFEYTKSFY